MHPRIFVYLGFAREDTLRDETRVELCILMLTNVVPLIIMAVAFGVIGVLIVIDRPTRLVAFIAITGTMVGLARVAISAAGQRCVLEASQVASWEQRYALGSYGFSLCVGGLGAVAFLGPVPVHHMLATALLFGYASGVVARGSNRPVIAVTSLIFATVPIVATIAVGLYTDQLSRAYLSLAVFISVFLVGSFETVRHVYRTVLALLMTRAELDRIARRDYLTGLPNRLEINEQLGLASQSQERDCTMLAVHCLDLDGFKLVNDAFGHAMGDRLLEQVAGRLACAVRKDDLVGRTGGDEFLIIQSRILDASEAEQLAARLVDVLSTPFDINGKVLRISASIGIGIRKGETEAMGSILECADRALYEVKARGKCGYLVHH